MAFLQEFSRIIILKDTPDTRSAFGFPIDENKLLTAAYGSTNRNANPYYDKLHETNFKFGWRAGYPDIDSYIQPNFSTIDNNNKEWVEAIRNNILQAIGTEESIINGYNKFPVSSGTGIIFQDKFYIGSTSTVSYTGIEADNSGVVVSGTGMPTFAPGTKIILSAVGDTGLSTSAIYYIYDSSATSFKLATSKSNALNGTAATSFNGSAGAGTGKIISKDFDYNASTTYASPGPELSVKDYIFWGEDPNDLKIGGRIKKVYTNSDPEYAEGARYQFEKGTNVAFPEYSGGVYDGEPIPQSIYYYRNTWNGKGIKNDVGTGFYVLIGIEQDTSGNYRWYPWLNAGYQGPNSDGIVDGAHPKKFAFTDYIRVRKISNPFKSDETNNESFGGDDLIPCTIHRTSNFYTEAYDANGNITNVLVGPNVIFPNICPSWAAYYVNPYGGDVKKLDKNTTYVLEINERLPAAWCGSESTFYGYALAGAI